MSYRDVNIIESMYPTNIQNQALEGLERWKRRNMEGNVSLDDMVQNLITALEEVNRHDVTEIIDGIIGSIISHQCGRSWVRATCRIKPKTIKLVLVASPLNIQHKGERKKTGKLGIRIMCLSGGHVWPQDCCLCELAHLKSK